LLWALAGFGLVATSILWWKIRPEIPDTVRLAAQNMRVGADDLQSWTELSNRIERTQTITDADWEVVKQTIAKPNMSTLGISTLMFVQPNFRHKEEALRLVRRYEATEQNPSRIVVLIAYRKLGDPVWRSRLDEALASADPGTREAAERVAARIRAKEQNGSSTVNPVRQ
jgi:hypothetical protein